MQENNGRTLTGVVVSRSGDKSLKVVIDYKIKHPKYGKYIRRRTKVGVHDQLNLGAVGDTVEVAECRPQSKTKSWRLVRVVQNKIN